MRTQLGQNLTLLKHFFSSNLDDVVPENIHTPPKEGFYSLPGNCSLHVASYFPFSKTFWLLKFSASLVFFGTAYLHENSEWQASLSSTFFLLDGQSADYFNQPL